MSSSNAAILVDSDSNGAQAQSSYQRDSDVTVADAVASLQRHLREQFRSALTKQHTAASVAQEQLYHTYDGSLMHPLVVPSSASPSTFFSGFRADALIQTLNQFEAQLLGPEGGSSERGGPTSVSTNERLRLLALLKEQSALALQEIGSTRGLLSAKELLQRRRRYRVGYPVSSADDGNGAHTLLERLAKECGLEIFASAEAALDDAGGEASTAMDTDGPSSDARQAPSKSTLTMAGKGIVLDIDIELSGQERSAVTGVRFSYGLEGSTDPSVDKLLSRQAGAAQWESFRDSLNALVVLDQLVPDPASESQGSTDGTLAVTPVDPFGAMKRLSTLLEEVFKAELEVASSPSYLLTTGHGLPVLHQVLPYATIIYHLPSAAFLSPEWAACQSTGFQGDAMASLLALPGCRSLRFSIELQMADAAFGDTSRPSFPLLDNVGNGLTSAVPDGLDERIGTGIAVVVHFNGEVWLGASTGRALLSVLQGGQAGNGAAASSAMSVPPLTAAKRTYQEVVLPGLQPGQMYQHSPLPDCPPIRTSLELSPSASSEAAFQLRSLRCSNAGQLLAALEVLRTQCLYNELLSTSLGVDGVVQGAPVLIPEEDESKLKLEDIFSDEPLQYSAVTITPDSSSYPPSLSATFPLPHLPSWLPLLVQFRIFPSSGRSSGFSVSYDLQGPSDALKARVAQVLDAQAGADRMEMVIGVSRDIKMLVRWIARRMQRSADVWKGIVAKPEW